MCSERGACFTLSIAVEAALAQYRSTRELKRRSTHRCEALVIKQEAEQNGATDATDATQPYQALYEHLRVPERRADARGIVEM